MKCEGPRLPQVTASHTCFTPASHVFHSTRVCLDFFFFNSPSTIGFIIAFFLCACISSFSLFFSISFLFYSIVSLLSSSSSCCFCILNLSYLVNVILPIFTLIRPSVLLLSYHFIYLTSTLYLIFFLPFLSFQSFSSDLFTYFYLFELHLCFCICILPIFELFNSTASHGYRFVIILPLFQGKTCLSFNKYV